MKSFTEIEANNLRLAQIAKQLRSSYLTLEMAEIALQVNKALEANKINVKLIDVPSDLIEKVKLAKSNRNFARRNTPKILRAKAQGKRNLVPKTKGKVMGALVPVQLSANYHDAEMAKLLKQHELVLSERAARMAKLSKGTVSRIIDNQSDLEKQLSNSKWLSN